MLTQVLVLCLLVVFLLPLGSGLPIVISRNGGSSARRRRRRERYIREEKWRVNTCSVARMVNPDIKLGECPNVINDYKQLYTRDSVSSLKNYYKGNCDILYIQERLPFCIYFNAFLATLFVLLASITTTGLIVALIMEIYSRIITLAAFLTRTNH